MYILREDIFSFHNETYSICLPSNASYREDGTAILDDEVSKIFQKKYPDFSEELGDKLELYGNQLFYFEHYNAFSFPIKNGWNEKPDLRIIEQSCKDLSNQAKYLYGFPILMPKPGCYPGGLRWEEVQPLLEYYIPDVLIITKE